MACTKHKRRENGKTVPVLKGLAADVKSQLDTLYNIHSVRNGGVRKYHGKPKVKIAPWWRRRGSLTVEACDPTYGEQELIIATRHPGAIARHLTRGLTDKGIMVAV